MIAIRLAGGTGSPSQDEMEVLICASTCGGWCPPAGNPCLPLQFDELDRCRLLGGCWQACIFLVFLRTVWRSYSRALFTFSGLYVQVVHEAVIQVCRRNLHACAWIRSYALVNGGKAFHRWTACKHAPSLTAFSAIHVFCRQLCHL